MSTQKDFDELEDKRIEGRTFWERLENESDEAYRAFSFYRDMGVTRTVKKTAALYYHDAIEKVSIVNQGQMANLLRWSKRWMWVARVEAFDLEESRQRSLKKQKQRVESSDFQYSVGTLLLQRAVQTLRLLGPDEMIPLAQVPKYVQAGVQLQKLALGDPTSHIEHTSNVHRGSAEPKQDDLDVSSLSVEDQEELARLVGLLEDNDGYVSDEDDFDGVDIHHPTQE